MFDAVKALVSSRKFLLTIAGTVVVTALSQLLPAMGLSQDMAFHVMGYVAGFFGVNVAGIAAEDFGKNRAK